MTQVSGDMTSGEMTLGRLDCKPLSLKLAVMLGVACSWWSPTEQQTVTV